MMRQFIFISSNLQLQFQILNQLTIFLNRFFPYFQSNFLKLPYKRLNQMEKDQHKLVQGKDVSMKSQENNTHETQIQNKPQVLNAIQIGLITFKVEVPRKTIDAVLKDIRKQVAKNQKLVVQGANRFQQKWRSFLPMIGNMRHTEFSFSNTKFNDILLIMRHISFQNLTYLSLECNNIANIESISFLTAGNLQKLDLSGNQISNCRALNKICFRDLNYLEICDNPLLEVDVGRLKCYQKKIYFRLMTHPYTKLFQNITFLAKLEKNVVSFIMSNQLKYYTGESKYGERHIKVPNNQKIIVQEKITNTIKRKLIFQKQL